jgi:glycosyltransferase involved in cell wall biosynthesis
MDSGKKIHILHLIPGLGIGGAERVVLSLHRTINPHLFRSWVLHWGSQEALANYCETRDANIIIEKLDKVISLSSLRRLYRHARSHKIDLIQTHLIDADLLGFITASLARIPFVTTIHSYPFPIEARHGWRYRFFSLFNGRFVCVSRTVKEHFHRVTGIPPKRIDVVHNGTSLEIFSKQFSVKERSQLRRDLSIPPEHHIVGTIARLIEDKGHRYLLAAIPKILQAHPKTTFLLIGDGELRAELEGLAQRLGLQKKVLFLGTRTDIPQLLDILDIFVYPTFREALGISVIEAMAMGKAIVATNDAAIPELIDHGKEGLLIPPGKPEEIAGAVIAMLADPVRRTALGGAARERAKMFSTENMVRSMEGIYLKMCGQSALHG